MEWFVRYFSILLIFCCTGLRGQEVFIIEEDTLNLAAEVRGDLSLFWNKDTLNPRFFVRKENRMLELKNTFLQGRPQYRSELERITQNPQNSIVDLEYTRESLGSFVRAYNRDILQQKAERESRRVFASRIGFFTGLTNNVYSENPDNVLAPLLGVEFEMFNPQFSWRHSIVLELEQSFKREDYRYTAIQFSLSYRYRFLQLNRLQIYGDASLGRLLYERDQYRELDEQGEVLDLRDDSEFKLQAPLSLGVGADFQVTQNGFITFGYNEVVSATLDSNGSFPIDITLGYRYQL